VDEWHPTNATPVITPALRKKGRDRRIQALARFLTFSFIVLSCSSSLSNTAAGHEMRVPARDSGFFLADSEASFFGIAASVHGLARRQI
jgi:hypothetical protein